MVSDNTAKLTSAVNSLPQLLEMKRLIDMHTTIATGMLKYNYFLYFLKLYYLFLFVITGILNSIKSRRLDTFFELEEKIMSKQTLDRSILDIINDPECGSPEDKLRLFIIYYLCTSISDADYNKHEAALSSIGCDLSPLLYVKRWRYLLKLIKSSMYTLMKIV